MKHPAILAYVHSHILGIALVAAGVSIHAAQPLVQKSLERVAATPSVLNLRASYYLAVGDVDCAIVLAQEAAKPKCSRT
jgi:hypothetical protein